MKQLTTSGIILTRSNFGEADRILTVLTPDTGKLRLMAKGVRRIKSKLAGGVELFSISHLVYIQGRGEIGTLISTRLDAHYGNIIKNIDRTMLGYDILKRLHKATEDAPESDYFDLLKQVFIALDDSKIALPLIDSWFNAQLLRLAGHSPNLSYDSTGQKLEAAARYNYSPDDASLVQRSDGNIGAADIKFLRLLFADVDVAVLTRIADVEQHASDNHRFIASLFQQYIH